MKKKHQTDRTNIQQLTQLFEEFNTIYNDNFFLVTPKKPQENEQ